MNQRDILRRIKDLAVVPIIRTPDSQSALAAVEAILEGGIDCVEITMTVDGAIRVIEAVADRYGDRVLLGAGTVLDPETARACMLAGAQFLVTPSLNVGTIQIAKRYSK
ncbi:MAG: 2-dehydro-3-deoxyphosphogluconate aldolase, partial [Acidobacteriaceae bacterium]|nr:2-dehydro-3-deoxyphosphogluconate aldolase [Acidobacteriaceae bacterium]